jgi:glucokinase
MSCNYLLGYDIGGTKTAIVLGKYDDNIEILSRIQFPTGAENSPQYTLDLLENKTNEIVYNAGLSINDILSIGISCGGPLDSRRGVILGPPNLPGWDEIHITEYFTNKFKVPVYLQNDANACALAEHKWGAGCGTSNMIFLTFGTGIGAGLILNGSLYAGTNDMAGEAGHIRLAESGPMGYGKHGSFEGFCSGSGIANEAKKRIRKELQLARGVNFHPETENLDHIDAHSVAVAARNGDPIAIAVYDQTAEYLGRGLSILIDILNPELIVIGSIFVRAHDLLWERAKLFIEQEALSISSNMCRVVPAALGEVLGDYAALSVGAAVLNQT